MSNPEIAIVNTRHGRMWIPIKDRYIGRSLDFYGEYSELEVKVFEQVLRPGMWALDVGANIGAFTLPMAKFVGAEGRVFAFEPQPEIFEILRCNCGVNGVNNAILLNAAAGNRSGEIDLPNVNYAVDGNFGGVGLGEGLRKASVATIDGLNLPRCDFMKVDVEGMELEALEGAEETIQRFRPIIYVENDRKEKSAALISFLLANGYGLRWHVPLLFNPDNFAGEHSDLWPGLGSVNMLCVPSEYKIEIRGFDDVDGPDDRPPGLKE